MIETLLKKNLNHVPLLKEALEIKGYDYIAGILLSSLNNSENFSETQKIAIRLATKEISYMGPSEAGADSVLIQILEMTWQKLGLDPANVDPLTNEGYEMIIEGLMDISRHIIYEESQRLLAMSQLPTQLPENWHLENVPYGYGYGPSGYGYGYDGIDFFHVFDV